MVIVQTESSESIKPSKRSTKSNERPMNEWKVHSNEEIDEGVNDTSSLNEGVRWKIYIISNSVTVHLEDVKCTGMLHKATDKEETKLQKLALSMIHKLKDPRKQNTSLSNLSV